MKPFKMLGEYKKYHNGMAGVEKWETTCANSSLLISPKFQYEANWNNFLPKFFFFSVRILQRESHVLLPKKESYKKRHSTFWSFQMEFNQKY